MSGGIYRLGDVCRISTGQSAPQDADAFGSTGHPFVRAGSLERLVSGESEQTLELIDQAKAAQYRLRLFPAGTIVFAKSGMSAKLGRVHMLGAPCHVVSHLATVEPSSVVHGRWLLHWFRKHSPTSLIANEAYPSIRTSEIEALEVELPEFREQHRIATILDRADCLRRKRQDALRLADAFLKAAFIDLFGDPVTNSLGWPAQRLASLGSLDRGVSKHRPRNDASLLGGDYALIQTGDVANCDGYIRAYTSTYSEKGLKQSKLWPAGTLCITIAANIAKTGILLFPACFPDSVVGFSASDRSTVEYVRFWLSFLQKTLEANAPASAQKNINLAILRELQIPVPPRDRVERFAVAVNKVEAIRKAQRLALDEGQKLNRALQQALLSP
jgi:type I restriction enzyme, S subunit